MKGLKRTIAVILGLSFILPMSACNIASNGGNNDEVISVAEDFSKSVKSGKVSKIVKASSKDYKDESDELSKKLDFEGTYGVPTCDVFYKIMDTIDYEIDENSAKISGDEASIVVNFTVADAQKVFDTDEIYQTVDDAIDELKDAKTKEIEVTLEMVSENDEWKVSNTSDVIDDVYSFTEIKIVFAIENNPTEETTKSTEETTAEPTDSTDSTTEPIVEPTDSTVETSGDTTDETTEDFGEPNPYIDELFIVFSDETFQKNIDTTVDHCGWYNTKPQEISHDGVLKNNGKLMFAMKLKDANGMDAPVNYKLFYIGDNLDELGNLKPEKDIISIGTSKPVKYDDGAYYEFEYDKEVKAGYYELAVEWTSNWDKPILIAIGKVED